MHNIKSQTNPPLPLFCGRSQQRDCVQLNHCQHSCTSRPHIHRSDSRPKQCLLPTEPRSINSLEMFPSERVSHLSCCTEHLCHDTHFFPRIALTRFPSASRTPPSLCPGSETIRTVNNDFKWLTSASSVRWHLSNGGPGLSFCKYLHNRSSFARTSVFQ